MPELKYLVPLDLIIKGKEMPIPIIFLILGAVTSIISQNLRTMVIAVLLAAFFTFVVLLPHYNHNPREVRIKSEGIEVHWRISKPVFISWSEVNWFEFRESPPYMFGFGLIWSSPNRNPFLVTRDAAEKAIEYYRIRTGKAPKINFVPEKRSVWK